MSGDDEDWFERALADTDDAEETGDTSSIESAVEPAEAPGDATSESAEDEDWFPDGDDGETVETTAETDTQDIVSEADEPDFETTASADTEPVVDDDEETGSLFDEDFSSALASAGGPGESEDTGEADFDDEDFESEIPRIDLGIDGLDGMIQGGIPHRHLMVVIGSPGTGKTTFGLQFLHHGLQKGENAVFVTLEQSRESIIDTADERGWDFDRYERDDSLAIVDLDPVEMANSLENIRGEFPELVREFGADRLVLDSVSLLEMMYDDQSRRRTEVFDFTRSLKQAGVTTMVTSEASEDNPYASRHGIIEYLTDAVFVLQYVRGDTQETRLAVEIQKIRNANHSRQTKPYAITLDGIDVYQQASIF